MLCCMQISYEVVSYAQVRQLTVSLKVRFLEGKRL